jgi:serine/threonine protein kinase
MDSTQMMFGPYQILERIGSGGMGDVYRAHDSRLGRTVAIKMLRGEINANPDMRARFEREARSAATLNNPHICAVYDVGSQDGIQYLVMEYLEGQTLAERMKDKRVSADDAILWGIQIAGALDEAHRSGLVHRDIKPGNIILTKAGVKLVDFGLAKEAPLPDSPDLAADGSLIGTVAYMSPEQVECREVDCRADLFAFGVILYEMLTGTHPFAGSTSAAIVSAILTVEPSPVGSAHLDHIVRRCLAKDPAERWQTARDLMLELEWFGGAAESAAPTGVQSQGRRWIQYALLAVLLIAVAWLSLLHFKQKPEAAETQFLISPPEKSTFASFALSPDGRAIALVTDRDGDASLSIRRLDKIGVTALSGTKGASYPFWSPDNRNIAFFAEGKLKRVSAAGGAPQVICEAPIGNGGTWNGDNVIVFTPGIFDGLYRVSASGGRPEPITTRDRAREENSHRWPSFLPDGQRFIFMIRSKNSGIYLGELGSQKTTRLLDSSSSATYSKGYLLFSRSGSLMAQPFDARAGRLTGEASVIADGVGAHPLRNAGFFSATAEGNLIFRQTAPGGAIQQLTFVDRSGFQHGEAAFQNTYLSLSLAPDGHRAAVQRFVDADRTEVWLMDLRGTHGRRFALDSAFPVWSRDGKRLLMMAFKDGRFSLYSKSVLDGRESGWLVPSSEPKFPLDWSPDGKFLLYEQHSPATKNDLMLVRSDGSGQPIALVQTDSNEADGRISPDAKWLAYTSDESGHPEVYVRPFELESHGAQWQVSQHGGAKSNWSADGKELFFVAADGQLMAVPVRAQVDFATGEAQALFLSQVDSNGVGQQYAPSRDGKGFFFLRPPSVDGSPLTVVLHWSKRAH